MTIVKSLVAPAHGYRHRIHKPKKYRGGRGRPFHTKTIQKQKEILKQYDLN